MTPERAFQYLIGALLLILLVFLFIWAVNKLDDDADGAFAAAGYLFDLALRR